MLFVNENIHKIKNTLFADAHLHVVRLNPIASNVGNCVEYEKEKTFKCECNANYQIKVTKPFYTSFLKIVENTEMNIYQNIGEKEHFSAFVILLKFYPRSAIFYLDYLFEKYNVSSKICLFASNMVAVDFRGRIVPENSTGQMEDRGTFANYESDIFKKVYELIAKNECDIRALGKKYYSKDKPVTWCTILLLVFYNLKMLHDIFKGNPLT